MSKDIVLAFSGGLDTSFCVPYLQERGWNVHTVFADTGGVDADERAFIEMADRRVEWYLFARIGHCIRHTHPGLAVLEQPQFPDYGQSEGLKMREAARWLDDTLAQQPYVAGERFTIADITAFCALEFARGLMKFVPGAEDMPHLQAWRDRVAERPCARAV